MNRLNRLLSVYRLCIPKNNTQPANASVRIYQPRVNFSDQLPRMKRPGEGKGPITWKSFKVFAIGGVVLFGALKYLEAKKDAGLDIDELNK